MVSRTGASSAISRCTNSFRPSSLAAAPLLAGVADTVDVETHGVAVGDGRPAEQHEDVAVADGQVLREGVDAGDQPMLDERVALDAVLDVVLADVHGVRIGGGQAMERPQVLEIDTVRHATQGSVARVPRKCAS